MVDTNSLSGLAVCMTSFLMLIVFWGWFGRLIVGALRRGFRGWI